MSPTEATHTHSRGTLQLTPALRAQGLVAYNVPQAETTVPVRIRLDGNEGAPPPASLFTALQQLGTDILRYYPKTQTLQELLALRLGVTHAQVLVTAGGDDALDRLCRAVLCEGRELIFPEPSFEMITRYAQLAGATIRSTPWLRGAYPLQEVLSLINQQTAMIAVVTPNNPTGLVATAHDIQALAQTAPQALILVDLAYGEFADRDLTQVCLEFNNVVMVRTFSKAYGLAGLRVGYAVGNSEILGWLRAVGAPYSVAQVSLELARLRLLSDQQPVFDFIGQIKKERGELCVFLESRAVEVLPSQGNFVFARFRNALAIRDSLAEVGIAVRAFPGRKYLENALRITCPGDATIFAEVIKALENALRGTKK